MKDQRFVLGALLSTTLAMTGVSSTAQAEAPNQASMKEAGRTSMTPWILDAIKMDLGQSPELDWSHPSAPDLREVEEAINARPTLSGPEQTLESEKFILHYTTEGDDAVTEAQALDAFEAIEYSWDYEVNHLGYPEPPQDSGLGGDERYDFYFTQQRFTYGYCSGEDFLDPNTMTSYIALATWMDTADIQVTVAHEFFHAIHFTMDALEDTWWFEVTAVWMEEQVYDEINDYLNYVPATMEAPEDALTDTSNMYANAIYTLSLTERFGDDIVKEIWTEASQSDNAEALMANRNVVEIQYSSDYDQVLHNFRESMVDTHRWEEGDSYGSVDPTTTVTFPLSTNSGSVLATGANIIAIPGDGGAPVDLSIAMSDSNNLVTSVLVSNNGVYSEFISDTGRGEGGTWTIPNFGDSYDYAYVVITNVAHARSDDYTLTVEAPGWGNNGGGCSTAPSNGSGIPALLFLPLMMVALRQRRGTQDAR